MSHEPVFHQMTDVEEICTIKQLAVGVSATLFARIELENPFIGSVLSVEYIVRSLYYTNGSVTHIAEA